MTHYDLIVVGSGPGGASLALRVAEHLKGRLEGRPC